MPSLRPTSWASPLQQGTVATDHLNAVQRRREIPTRLTQRSQVFLQDRVIHRVLGSRHQPSLPLLLRLMRRWPLLRRVPARVVDIGFRPEHVKPTKANRLG